MPKTTNNIFDGVISIDNLYRGYLAARKMKRFFPDILRYMGKVERNLVDTQTKLLAARWRPGTYRVKIIFEPKRREIHAPKFKDRVVHHALMNYLYDIFDKKMIYDSYASRVGKGKDACRDRLNYFYRKMYNKYEHNFYYLKGDISKFFPSVKHDVLFNEIQRTIKDRRLLNLLKILIYESDTITRGISIGAVTSQLFANIIMNPFDHHIKDDLGIKYYLRYADDFVILHEDKNYLRDLKVYIAIWLHEHLDLLLNSKSYINKATNGIDFVGYRIYGSYVKLRKRVFKQFRRKLCTIKQKYASTDLLDIEKVRCLVNSYLGMCKHCRAYRSVDNILNNFAL